jgi:hypothetical protein
VFAQKPRHDRMVNLLILRTQNFKNQTAHKQMFLGVSLLFQIPITVEIGES